jgi:hypothetical protein
VITIGSFSVVPAESTESIEHRTLNNEPSEGIAWVFDVVTAGAALRVADIAWDTGDRDVRAVAVTKGEQRLGRLLRGGRIGVYEANFHAFPEGLSLLELAVMKLKPEQPGRLPTAVKADYGTLRRAAAGVSVWDELSSLGASSIGPRSELIGDTGNRRGILVTTFRSDNRLVPAAAFILIRVIPLWTEFAG